MLQCSHNCCYRLNLLYTIVLTAVMCNAFLVSNYKDEQSDNKLFITCYRHLMVNGSGHVISTKMSNIYKNQFKEITPDTFRNLK